MTTDISQIRPAALAYRYEFAPDEVTDIVACTETHGFCVVRGLLPDSLVDILQSEVRRVVDPNGTLGPGESRTHLSFIEEATEVWEPWRGHEPFMNLHRTLLGTGMKLTFRRLRDGDEVRVVTGRLAKTGN